MIQTLKNASINNTYIINDKYKVKFLKSGLLFNEFRRIDSCPTWEAFEYATCMNTNETIKISVYEHSDLSENNATIYFMNSNGTVKSSSNIINIIKYE